MTWNSDELSEKSYLDESIIASGSMEWRLEQEINLKGWKSSRLDLDNGICYQQGDDLIGDTQPIGWDLSDEGQKWSELCKASL